MVADSRNCSDSTDVGSTDCDIAADDTLEKSADAVALHSAAWVVALEEVDHTGYNHRDNRNKYSGYGHYLE